MAFLIALILMQFGEAPFGLDQYQIGNNRAKLTQNVVEFNEDGYRSGVHASGFINLNAMRLSSRDTTDPVSGSIMDNALPLGGYRSNPHRGSTDVREFQLNLSGSHTRDLNIEVSTLQVLHRADRTSGFTRSQGGNDQANGRQQNADDADQRREQVQAQPRNGDAVAGRGGFYGRPLGAQVGILAVIGVIAGCSIFGGLIMLCLGRGWSRSTKVNTFYGGVVTAIGLLLLTQVFYLSIADVAG